jgi:hypothetical protein
MLFGETVAVYCENHKEYINTPSKQNVEFQYVTAGDTYSNHFGKNVWRVWTVWTAKQSILHNTVTVYGDYLGLCEDFVSKFGYKRIWLLHHDNAPSHISFFTRTFLTKNNMAVAPHSSYISLFPKPIIISSHIISYQVLPDTVSWGGQTALKIRPLLKRKWQVAYTWSKCYYLLSDSEKWWSL